MFSVLPGHLPNLGGPAVEDEILRWAFYGVGRALPPLLRRFQLGVIAMEPWVAPAHVPASAADLSGLAREWWRAADALHLVGEAGGGTVFVMDFGDGCRYFGYTRGPVFGRLATLICGIARFGLNQFVAGHAARVPYLVRCVASGMEEWQARDLRRLLVLEAPADLKTLSATTVRSAGSCLEEQGPEVVRMSFHEAAGLGLFSGGEPGCQGGCQPGCQMGAQIQMSAKYIDPGCHWWFRQEGFDMNSFRQ